MKIRNDFVKWAVLHTKGFKHEDFNSIRSCPKGRCFSLSGLLPAVGVAGSAEGENEKRLSVLPSGLSLRVEDCVSAVNIAFEK